MRLPPEVVLATTNASKAREIVEVFSEIAGLSRFVPRPPGVPEVPETAEDFEGNALAKATALCDATGLPALADDSGLEVDHLDGAPGVRSARFAGEEADDAANRGKLLEALVGLPGDHPGRRARFRCVVVLIDPGGETLVGHGVVQGRIVTTPRGSGGFGYDPLFLPAEGDGRTFAEMAPGEKNAISHRGRALHDLVAVIRES